MMYVPIATATITLIIAPIETGLSCANGVISVIAPPILAKSYISLPNSFFISCFIIQSYTKLT
jgi:hypothetical protein